MLDYRYYNILYIFNRALSSAAFMHTYQYTYLHDTFWKEVYETIQYLLYVHVSTLYVRVRTAVPLSMYVHELVSHCSKQHSWCKVTLMEISVQWAPCGLSVWWLIYYKPHLIWSNRMGCIVFPHVKTHFNFCSFVVYTMCITSTCFVPISGWRDFY